MNDSLQTTLEELIQSGKKFNPALSRLISANTEYHFVLVVVSGLFLLACTLLSIFFWRSFRKIPDMSNRKWTFEKKTYFCFCLVSTLVGSFLALIVLANANNVLNPQREFLGSIGMLGAPRVGSPADKRHQLFNTWLRSGSSAVPALIQSKIADRLAWQRPKAIICSVLLIVFVMLSHRIWRTLIRASPMLQAQWKLREVTLLTAGIFTVTACLPLMLMVMGNTQAAVAPLSLTLFFG